MACSFAIQLFSAKSLNQVGVDLITQNFKVGVGFQKDVQNL